jgi:hypothetical protein
MSRRCVKCGGRAEWPSSSRTCDACTEEAFDLPRGFLARTRRQALPARDAFAAAPASRMARDQLEALTTQASRYEPLPVYKEVPPRDWQDDSHDRWGAPARGPLGKQWAGGCCIRAAVASLLNVHISQVPDPAGLYNPWFDTYNQQVADKTGHRLERLPRSLCPPKTHELWIAHIREDGDADHAVVARDGFVVHDSAGTYQGQLPLNRLDGGFVLRPTTRVVPILSPLGSGRVVVAA